MQAIAENRKAQDALTDAADTLRGTPSVGLGNAIKANKTMLITESEDNKTELEKQ